MARFGSVLVVLAALAVGSLAPAQDRDIKVRGDKARVAAGGEWVYDNLESGLAEAKKTGKPLFVVLRCIPCDACRGLDDKVVVRDDKIASLMPQFVCVRIIKGNGLDLSLFEFDYDLSFYAFFLNADRTVYGRFTSLSARTDAPEVSLEGLHQAMIGALALHKSYPANKELLAGKTPTRAPKYATPEQMPTLKGKYKSELDFEGKVAQSCIHCHQIRDAQRREIRDAKVHLSDEVLYPWPMPDVVGLTLDPRKQATVEAVVSGSTAAQVGFRVGDQITKIRGQQPISVADVQWALHNAPEPTKIEVAVKRANGDSATLTLPLNSGWRRGSDLSIRPTTWDLRRMAFGGVRFNELTPEERAKLKLKDDELGLLLKHVGQYNEHAGAKNAGFQAGDILISIDGSTARRTESQLIAESVQKHLPGDKRKAVVLRGEKRLELMLPVN